MSILLNVFVLMANFVLHNNFYGRVGMKPTKVNRDDIGYPAVLANIASPPRHLYCLGLSLTEILSSPAVAIVGSRKVSSYGQQVTFNLASELANKGIVII